jgi:hypothetical protein
MTDAVQVAMRDIAEDATISAVYRLWEERRGGRAAPSPTDMDVFALPRSAVSHVVTVDVIDGGARFRFRVIGSRVVIASGTDFTGRYVDEALSGWMRDTVVEQYRAVVSACRPGYAMAEFGRDGWQPTKNRRLALPLSSDGETVDRLLLVSRASAPWILQGDLLNLALASDPEIVRSFTLI